MVVNFLKRNKKKFIATTLIVALGFLIWQEPILSKASSSDDDNKLDNQNVEDTANMAKDSFKVDLEDGSYMQYTVTDKDVTCDYYKYQGVDENGNNVYSTNSSTVDIMDEKEAVDNITRGGEGPLYWKKIVKDRLKRQYSYQTGTKGNELFYRIGWEKQLYTINYSSLPNTLYVDEYIKLLDSINKQIVQCLAVAIGAVMVAIAAIIASYCAVGAKDCLSVISSLLNKCGVTLIQITPIGFGHMVFKLYDDYVELEKKFAMAATYGIPD